MSPPPPPPPPMAAAAIPPVTNPVSPVPIPHLDPVAYTQRLTSACSTSAAARDALRAEYVHAENYARTLFAQHRHSAKEIQNPHVLLLPLHDLPAAARHVPRRFPEDLAAPTVFAQPLDAKPAEGAQILADRAEFALNWKLFTSGALDCLNWDNVFAAGGSVQACLTHLDPATSYGDRRDYFLEKHAAADIDLFLYGLDEEAAKAKMQEIYDQITDAVPFEMVAIRTTHSVSICAQFPYRHIQIILRLYASPSETLMGFDVDSCAVGFNGQQVLLTPRAHFALLTQTNAVDMTRRSPTYESRLAKYAKRGFEIRVPSLRRDEIDPQIYERSFDKVRGLARLLLFEALGDQEVRIEYKETQRRRKGRPQHPNAGHFQSRQYMRSKDLKAQEALEATSDYSHVFIPYGPEYTASRIVRVLFKKDKNINNEWFMRKRGVRVHQHPVFMGSMADILTDCCGACPKPESEQDLADLEKFVHGDLKFITDDPGRQSIGSFHPLTDDDWASDAYIPGDRAPLFAAVARGDLAALTAHLDAHPDHDLEARDWVGRTLLHLAVVCAHTDVVKELVKRGARVSAPMPDGRLPLHLAVEYGLQDIAEIVWEKQVENAAALPPPGEEGKQEKKDADGDVEMQDADSDKDNDDEPAPKTKAVSALYDDAEAEGLGPDVHEIDHRDWDYAMAPLDYAILYGHMDLVRWLLEQGAAVKPPTKATTASSRSPTSPNLRLPSTKPLALAMLCTDMSRGMLIAEMLIERGAKLDVSVLSMALQLDGSSDTFGLGKSKAKASTMGRGSAFFNFFLETDAAIASPKSLDELVMVAVNANNSMALRKILSMGGAAQLTPERLVETDGIDKDTAEGRLRYFTQPIAVAIPQYGGDVNLDIVAALLEHGADVKTQYNSWNETRLIDAIASSIQSDVSTFERYLPKQEQDADKTKGPKDKPWKGPLRTCDTYDEFVRALKAGPFNKDKLQDDDADLVPEKLIKDQLARLELGKESWEKLNAKMAVYNMLYKAGARLHATPDKTSWSPNMTEIRVYVSNPWGPGLLKAKRPSVVARERAELATKDAGGTKKANDAATKDVFDSYSYLSTGSKSWRASTAVQPDMQPKYLDLFRLVWAGDVQAVVHHVKTSRVLVTVANSKGLTPLEVAVLRHNADMVAALIQIAHAQYKKPEKGEEVVKAVNNYDLDRDHGSGSDGDSDGDDYYEGSDEDDDDDDDDMDDDDDDDHPSHRHAPGTTTKQPPPPPSHSTTHVRDFITHTYSLHAGTDQYPSPQASSSSLTIAHHCVQDNWRAGLQALFAAIRAIPQDALAYGWEVIKKGAGITFVHGDFICDLVGDQLDHHPTSNDRLQLSYASPFALAIKLGHVEMIQFLMQESLGGFQMAVFHHLDGRLEAEQAKQDMQSGYSGMKTAERYLRGRASNGLPPRKKKKAAFDPAIELWTHAAVGSTSTAAIEYFASPKAAADVVAFVAAKRGVDPRADELAHVDVRKRFVEHVFSLTAHSRGVTRHNLLHYAVAAWSSQGEDVYRANIKGTLAMLAKLRDLISAKDFARLLNAQGGPGKTPLYLALSQPGVSRRILTTLLDYGADPTIQCTHRGWTALHHLCSRSTSPAMVKYVRSFLAHCSPLHAARILSCRSTRFQHTPLAVATLAGNHDVVKYLLGYLGEHLAEFQRVYPQGFKGPHPVLHPDFVHSTPVQLAANMANVEMLRLLHAAQPKAAAWHSENADGATLAGCALQAFRYAMHSGSNLVGQVVVPDPNAAGEGHFVEVEMNVKDVVEAEASGDVTDEEADEAERNVAKAQGDKKDNNKVKVLRSRAAPVSLLAFAHEVGVLDRDQLGRRVLVPQEKVVQAVTTVSQALKGELSWAQKQELSAGQHNAGDSY